VTTARGHSRSDCYIDRKGSGHGKERTAVIFAGVSSGGGEVGIGTGIIDSGGGEAIKFIQENATKPSSGLLDHLHWQNFKH